LPWDLQYSWEDCINALLQVSPLELDLLIEEAMHSALDIQSTFLDMSHSITTRHHPHTAMDLSHAEITTSASQLEAQLQAALTEHFPESWYHWALSLSGCRHGPMTISPMIPAQTRWYWSRLDTYIHR
jgi:hypothetical protein